MTIREICQIINIKLSKENKAIENLEAKSVTNLTSHAQKGNRLYFDTKQDKITDQVLKAILDSNTVIITNKDYDVESFYKKQLIKTDNPYDKYCLLGKKIFEKYNIPTIGITGSVGKTTTTRFLNLVFSEKYKVFSAPITSNTPTYFVEEIYKNLNQNYDFYIQETGALTPKSVEIAATILNPTAYILTNINKYHHLDKYKTSEELIKDKLSYDKVASKDTFGIINIDDEELKKHKYRTKIITYAVNNKKADYTAENIIQINDTLKLTIIDNKKHKKIPIEMNIIGIHNAYNILAVYALAKEFNISDDEIINGLSKYQTVSLRQEFKTIGGRKFYIDSFNVCADSIKTASESMEKIETKKTNKRIAIIGGENGIGDLSYDVNFKTGTILNKYNLDTIICFGPKENTEKEINLKGNGKALYDGAKTVVKNKKLLYYDNLKKLAKFLKYKTKPGDLILIKGIFRLGLFSAIDLAFGTNVIYRHTYFTNNAEKITTDDFEGIIIKEINSISIKKIYLKTKN